MEKVTYIWKNKLSRFEPLTVIQTSNSVVFIVVWLSLEKSVCELSMVYKKISALIWLRVYNHNFSL